MTDMEANQIKILADQASIINLLQRLKEHIEKLSEELDRRKQTKCDSETKAKKTITKQKQKKAIEKRSSSKAQDMQIEIIDNGDGSSGFKINNEEYQPAGQWSNDFICTRN